MQKLTKKTQPAKTGETRENGKRQTLTRYAHFIPVKRIHFQKNDISQMIFLGNPAHEEAPWG